jgi:hypothetical protein
MPEEKASVPRQKAMSLDLTRGCSGLRSHNRPRRGTCRIETIHEHTPTSYLHMELLVMKLNYLDAGRRSLS